MIEITDDMAVTAKTVFLDSDLDSATDDMVLALRAIVPLIEAQMRQTADIRFRALQLAVEHGKTDAGYSDVDAIDVAERFRLYLENGVQDD